MVNVKFKDQTFHDYPNTGLTNTTHNLNNHHHHHLKNNKGTSAAINPFSDPSLLDQRFSIDKASHFAGDSPTRMVNMRSILDHSAHHNNHLDSSSSPVSKKNKS